MQSRRPPTRLRRTPSRCCGRRQAARALRNMSAAPDFATAVHFPPPVLRAVVLAAAAADSAVAADEAAGERPGSAPWGTVTSRWLGESIGDTGGGVGGGVGGSTLGGSLSASPATVRVELLLQLNLCLRNLAGRDGGAAVPALVEHGACVVAASAARRASDRVGAQAAGLLVALAAHAARLTSPPGRGGRSGAAARALLQARLADAKAAEMADAQLGAHLHQDRAAGHQEAASGERRPVSSSSSAAADGSRAADTPPTAKPAEPPAAAMGAALRCRLMHCLLVSFLARLAAGRPADWEDGCAGAEAPAAFLARCNGGLPAEFELALLGGAGRAARRHRGSLAIRQSFRHFFPGSRSVYFLCDPFNQLWPENRARCSRPSNSCLAIV
jgi:hypothetical protein